MKIEIFTTGEDGCELYVNGVKQNSGTVYIEGKPYYTKDAADITLYDYMVEMHGAKEWDDTVGKIQKWYYGSYVKEYWCATSISYCAYLMGILDDIGGKNENVYLMMEDCKYYGIGEFFKKDKIPKQLKKGDILFYNWDGGQMTTTSSKHVSICAKDTTSDSVLSEGGNQKDKICALFYDRGKLDAVFRPDYKSLRKRGNKN